MYHHAPQPYKFGYDIKDKHGEQYRQEEGNGGQAVKGSYGFTDARGVKRQVNYVADHAGFRAQVKTNEPGTANQNPAAVLMVSDAPYAGGMALGGVGLRGVALGPYGMGNVGLGAVAPGYAVSAGLGGLGYGVGGLGYARYGY